MRNLYLSGSFTFFLAELTGCKTLTAGREDRSGPPPSSHPKIGQRGRIQDKSEIKLFKSQISEYISDPE